MKETKRSSLKYYLQNELGGSLVFALLSSFLLIMLVTIVVHFSNTDIRSAKKQEKQTTAFYIAEAGVEKAIQDINDSLKNGVVPPLYIEDTHFEEGSYQVNIIVHKNANHEKEYYEIVSTGQYFEEEQTIVRKVRQPLWPKNGNQLSGLEFALFAAENLCVQTISEISLLLLALSTHEIKVNGDIHGNDSVTLKYTDLSSNEPDVNGEVSSTSTSHINIEGIEHIKATPRIPMPEFDFDYARKQAKETGLYIGHSVLDLSLLGLSTEKLIFIDGDLAIVGTDLLGISLANRTIIVNGNITGAISLGGSATDLNLIAKEDITFSGVLTGLLVNGILFSQNGTIKTDGHLEVDGYIGAKEINIGSKLVLGLLGAVTGILTGDMVFAYDHTVFEQLPNDIGFKQSYVQVIE